MNLLFISREFPGKREPEQATFNRQQIGGLSARMKIKVISPRPWFPFCRRHLYYPILPLIEREKRGNIEIFYPKFFNLPVLGRNFQPFFLSLALCRTVRKIRRNFPFDAIYTNPLYPDAAASLTIGRRFKVPITAAALGSDVNMSLNSRWRRRQLMKVLKNVSAVMTVSNDLQKKVTDIFPQVKCKTIYDGVDHTLFQPIERAEARKLLGLKKEGKIILFIGNLLKSKGVQELKNGFLQLAKPGDTLFFIGDGPMKKRLADKKTGCAVILKGRIPHQEISLWLNAADLLCLPSYQEGVPNVILEALACGTPVVATKVGGIPEILPERECGILVPAGDTLVLMEAIKEALKKEWDRKKIRLQGLKFSWEKNVKELEALIKSTLF